MPFCDFAKDDAMGGVTAVSNLFLLEYMPLAAPEFVKVYLYGLMLCTHPELCDSVEKMAEALHMDLNTVKNAFSYWAREGLVEKLSDNPPSYSFVTLTPGQSQEAAPDDALYDNREYIRTLQNMMPSLAIENREIRKANDWLDVFKLDRDCVYFLVENEIKNRYKNGNLPSAGTMFKHLDSTAKKWAEAGVHSVKEAQQYAARDSRQYQTALKVIERMNQQRQPTLDEIALVQCWTQELGYTEEAIVDACREMTKAGQPSFAYLDKVLKNQKTNPDDGLREKVKTLNAHLGIALVPTPEQTASLREFLGMGFEFAAIEQAAAQCGQNGRRRYEDISRKLSQWRGAGVFTVADIERERERRRHDTELAYKVLGSAGLDRRPSEQDEKSVRLWSALIGEETLLYAASQAHGTENPIRYIDKIVKNWSARGINTPEKAKAEAQAKPDATTANPSKIMNERDYKEDDFAEWTKVDIKSW